MRKLIALILCLSFLATSAPPASAQVPEPGEIAPGYSSSLELSGPDCQPRGTEMQHHIVVYLWGDIADAHLYIRALDSERVLVYHSHDAYEPYPFGAEYRSFYVKLDRWILVGDGVVEAWLFDGHKVVTRAKRTFRVGRC